MLFWVSYSIAKIFYINIISSLKLMLNIKFQEPTELFSGWTVNARTTLSLHLATLDFFHSLTHHYFSNQWTFWARGQHLPTIPATGGGPLNGLQLTPGLYRSRPSRCCPTGLPLSQHCVYANATRCPGPRTPIPRPPVANYSFGRRFCLPLPFCLTPPTPG